MGQTPPCFLIPAMSDLLPITDVVQNAAKDREGPISAVSHTFS
jgi:hypothetical protein